MNIQQNNHYLNFHAGLTKQMKAEIRSCDINKISNELAKVNIQTDFRGNKVVAWCCLKCYELFKSLKLPLPNGIFVENFNENLNIQEQNSIGFNNALPCRIYKNKDFIVPEKTLFFNENPSDNEFDNFWKHLDEIVDKQYAQKVVPNNFFLDTFLHEFAHAAHEGNLISRFNPKKLEYHYLRCCDEDYSAKFRVKYYKILSKICDYAAESPHEAIACDMSNRFVNNMDKNSLIMKQNFIPNSPYKKLSLKEKIIGVKKSNNIDSLIRNFWYGKIDLQ